MRKPQIFISHTSKDADFALAIKQWIHENLLGGVKLFVSSDKGDSIPLGSEWPQKIKDSLEDSSILIVLLSHNSKAKRWIYWEAGAGYVRGIPVIPICIGGLIKKELPSPLNHLQAIVLPSKDGENQLIEIAAKSADLLPPKNLTPLNLPKRKITDASNNVSEFEVVDKKDFKSEYYRSEVKVELVKFLISSKNKDRVMTLTEIESEMGLKGQKKRRYILEILEYFLKLDIVEKTQSKNTTWKLIDKGQQFLNLA